MEILRRVRRKSITVFRRHIQRISGIHPTAFIAPGSKVRRDLVMHAHSFVNSGCFLTTGVALGRYTLLGPNVAIVGADHVFDLAGVPITFSGRPEKKETFVGRDVWIGFGAIILAGVTIGDGAIIGAGSVITRDVPPFAVYAGIPGKFIRERFTLSDRQTHQAMLEGDLLDLQKCAPKSAL